MSEIAEKLRAIADASRREDGTDIPLGEQCREAADELDRLRETQAEQDVLAERRRQKSVEGYDAAHDDKLGAWELGNAAASYAMWRPFDEDGYLHESLWPWHGEHWKPKDRRCDLVRAGALILAEIERMDRTDARSASKDRSSDE